MIRLTVAKAARQKGVKNAYQLALKLGGVQHKAKAARLWKGTGAELETIGEVAAVLGCDASELFVWTPDKEAKKCSARRGRSKKKTIVKRRTKAAAG